MQLKRRISVCMLLTVAILVPSHQLWLPSIGKFLVVEDPLPSLQQPTDAIVPLAGGTERVMHAAYLFGQGYSTWFAVTDVAVSSSSVQSKEGQREAIALGVPAERIRLTATKVRTTADEARALYALAQNEGWRSLIVVTSKAHTRRSRLIFGWVFAGSGIDVIVQPAPGKYNPEHWWSDPKQIYTTAYEYLGMLALPIRLAPIP